MDHQQNNPVLASKQAYLRTHVPANQYQDFAQYCQSIVGNIDIETWQLEYMKQLVQSFLLLQRQKQAQKQKNKDKNHSFHLYQTGDSKDIKALAQDIQRQQQNIKNNSPSHQPPFQQNKTPPRDKQQKSALQFLDKIVQRQDKIVEKQGKMAVKVVEGQGKTGEEKGKAEVKYDKTKFESKKYDKSFFQSGRIWQVPVVQQSNHSAGNKINFQQIFPTSKNPAQIKEIKKEAYQLNKKQVQFIKPASKNQRLFEQIAIEDDNQAKPKLKAQQSKQTKITNFAKPIKKNIKVPYDREIIIKSNFKAKVACFKSFQRVTLASKELKVVIEEHEVVNRFLSSDYVMYQLKVLPSNTICRRNLEDFFKLRKQIQMIYPGIRLPYLQKIGWLQSQLKPEVIAKQKKFLTYFLQDLLSNHELRNSRILEDFLTLKDHKLMKRKFEQYQKLKQISGIEQLCLLEGEVKVELTQENRQYNEHTEQFTQNFSRLLSEKIEVLMNIEESHRLLAENYQRLNNLSIQIDNQIILFNSKLPFKQIPFLSDTFKNLLTYAQQHISIHTNESCLLRQNIVPFIRYQKQNLSTITPLLAANRQLLSSYLKQKDSDNQPLDYLSERLAPYKQNILQQSKNIVVLKYQCGYLQNCLVEETFHYFQVMSQQLDRLLSDVCYKKLNSLSSTINTLTTLVYA